jgi:hypothetical protein
MDKIITYQNKDKYGNPYFNKCILDKSPIIIAKCVKFFFECLTCLETKYGKNNETYLEYKKSLEDEYGKDNKICKISYNEKYIIFEIEEIKYLVLKDLEFKFTQIDGITYNLYNTKKYLDKQVCKIFKALQTDNNISMTTETIKALQTDNNLSVTTETIKVEHIYNYIALIEFLEN